MDGLNPNFVRHAPEIVVDAFHGRDVPPAEAENIVAECLEMTRRSLAVALWRALEEMEAPAVIRDGASFGAQSAAADPGLAAAVRQQRRLFLPRFIETFETIFERRIDGRDRASPRVKDESVVLALVHHGEVEEQVALKKSIRAMYEAVREERFALDLRVRVLLGESASPGEFDNPWRVSYICDALGAVCRELWPHQHHWRPIMLCAVRVATPQVLSLYQELNAYLQDCDILPEVRVRSHRLDDKSRAERVAPQELFSTLIQHYADDSIVAGDAAGEFATSEPAPHVNETGAAEWYRRATKQDQSRRQAINALIQALSSLQPTPAAIDAAAQADAGNPDLLCASLPGSAVAREPSLVNKVRFARLGLLRRLDSPADHATVEVIAGLMDCILCEPYLPDAVKLVFARLQIPLLKSALADQAVFTSAQHPTRSFLDSLSRALVGLRDGDPQAGIMLQLAHRLADRISAAADPDQDPFTVAKPELDRHLDGERVLHDQRISATIPELQARETRIVAREKVQEILSVQLAGSRVPAAVHRLLTHEWLEHLTDKYLDGGPESAAWNHELALIDDLMWSLSADAARDRPRLRRLVPGLVKSLSNGHAVGAVAEPWRKLVLEYMFKSHLGALRAAAERLSVQPPLPLQISLPPPAATASGTVDARVHAVARGDWCEFRPAGQDEPVLARLTWRSPHRTQLLFTHRNGTTAFVHTPASLSEEFRAERVVVALEDVSVFERAMRHLLGDAEQPGRP